MAMPDRDDKHTNDDGEEMSSLRGIWPGNEKVQDMQGWLQVMQEDLAVMKFTAVVGGGAVRATVTGRQAGGSETKSGGS